MECVGNHLTRPQTRTFTHAVVFFFSYTTAESKVASTTEAASDAAATAEAAAADAVDAGESYVQSACAAVELS